MMNGRKWLQAEVTASASSSQGSHRGWCCFNLALKKPASKGRLMFGRVRYMVAPIPQALIEASVTIHN
jgi:hypothetical protein